MLTGLHGEQMMMALNATFPGHAVLLHTRLHERIGMACAGRAILRSGYEERVVQQGDFCCISTGVPYGETALGNEAFVMLDIFYPVRDDFTAHDRGTSWGYL